VGNPDPETMRGVAAECVNLVGEQFGKQLGFPFSTARRILSGGQNKSLASFARALPAIAEHSRQQKEA